MNFIRARIRSIGLALRTWPDRRAWAWCGAIFLAYAVIAAPVGWAAGFFQIGLPDWSISQMILLPLVLLITPAIGEELLFRALPLPHISERPTSTHRVAASVLALAAFILWHPLNGLWTPRVWPVFTDPAFLALAALLGIACTLAYLVSGSIWPAVLIHWVTVVVWGLFLGGPKELDVQSLRNLSIDTVVDCSGTQAGLDLSSQIVKDGGRLNLFGWNHGTGSFPGDVWHMRGLTVVNSAPNSAERDPWPAAIRLLDRKLIDLTPLVSHVVPPDEYPSLLERATTRGSGYMKGVVRLKAA